MIPTQDPQGAGIGALYRRQSQQSPFLQRPNPQMGQPGPQPGQQQNPANQGLLGSLSPSTVVNPGMNHTQPQGPPQAAAPGAAVTPGGQPAPPAPPPGPSPFVFRGFDPSRSESAKGTLKYDAYNVLQGFDPADPASMPRAFAILSAMHPGQYELDPQGNLMLTGTADGYIGARPQGWGEGGAWHEPGQGPMQWQWLGYNDAHPGPHGEGLPGAGGAGGGMGGAWDGWGGIHLPGGGTRPPTPGDLGNIYSTPNPGLNSTMPVGTPQMLGDQAIQQAQRNPNDPLVRALKGPYGLG